jgi:hypothetical protein
MISTKRVPLYNYTTDNGKDKEAFIDIANEGKGGESSYGDGSSIRKTVYDIQSGNFDLPSSKEVQTIDMVRMVIEGATDDVFSKNECIAMRDALDASIARLP